MEMQDASPKLCISVKLFKPQQQLMIYFDSSQTAPERISRFQHYPCRGAKLWELQSHKAKLSSWFCTNFCFVLPCFASVFGKKLSLADL